MKLIILPVLFFCSILSFSQSDTAVDKRGAISRLSGSLKFQTVSFSQDTAMDSSAFRGLRGFLERSFPLIHAKLDRKIFNEFSYVYKWPGTNPLLKPYVLMAHSDVVPVEKETVSAWRVPPFEGLVRNDTIYGRGAVDDKGQLMAMLEAAETLLRRNVQPERTIYLCFGHDEELSGLMGMKVIAAWFRENNIIPELVLDEGLEVVSKRDFFRKDIALIGVGEKGHASFELSIAMEGGHSSVPKEENAITVLARAITRIKENPMPMKMITPVNDFFHRIKPIIPGFMRFVINNQWLFRKILLNQMSKNFATNAAVRTTLVTTIVQSGFKDNVIATHAKGVVNSRILHGETIDDVEEHLNKIIDDDRIKVTRLEQCWNPSSITSIESPAYKKIESLASEFFPEAITAPFILLGASDSRYFRELSEGVINFAPVVDSEGFHGVNENRPVPQYIHMIRFFMSLMSGK